jgi:hypothetical protein
LNPYLPLIAMSGILPVLCCSWLGNGLFSDLDAGHHAAMKDILLPAFRAQSVKDLVPLFVEVGMGYWLGVCGKMQQQQQQQQQQQHALGWG